MPSSESDILDQAEAALRACLERVPFIALRSIEREPRPDGPDLGLRLRVSRGSRRLIVEVRSSGQPRVIREAINQLARYRDRPRGGYAVVVAPYISPRAGQLCVGENVGFVDLAGNCRLCFDQVFIEQTGRTNPEVKRRDLRSLYSPKASRVLRVLLDQPRRAWQLQQLAKEAQVSLGLASNVKKLLTDREWIGTVTSTRTGAKATMATRTGTRTGTRTSAATNVETEGLRLLDPAALLGEWAASYSFRKNQLVDCYTLRDVAEAEAGLAEECSKRGWSYALTGFSGAARLVPAVRYQRAMAYVGGPPEELLGPLQLKVVESGANVSLLVPYDEGVFQGARRLDDIDVVSPVQLYLDLRSFRGRGEEAAEQILEEVIKPTW